MKNLIFSIGILLITGMIIGGISIAATDDITATVTAENVAVSVTDGSVAYLTVEVGAVVSTTASGVNETQTIDNTGNVDGDISISGSDSTNWEIDPVIGSEQFAHKSCTSTCASTPTWTYFDDEGYTTLNDNTASTTDISLDLLLLAPNDTSNYGQQSMTVTIQIAASS